MNFKTRKIIAIIGDNQQLIDKKLKEFYEKYGEWNFANSVEDKKPMQEWIILHNSNNLIKILEITSCNIIIISDFLFKIPIEIRIWCEIFIYEKHVDIKINENKGFQLWYLMIKKYISKDILRNMS